MSTSLQHITAISTTGSQPKVGTSSAQVLLLMQATVGPVPVCSGSHCSDQGSVLHGTCGLILVEVSQPPPITLISGKNEAPVSLQELEA